jgi:hypothetical protein
LQLSSGRLAAGAVTIIINSGKGIVEERSMVSYRIGGMAFALLILANAAHAGAPPAAGPRDDARVLAAKVDALIGAGYAKAKVKAADLADDATFLRRASLDLTGKIPTVSEVRRFLSDRSPNKRAKMIDRLLSSPGYVNHFTNIWRDLLMPEAAADFNRRYMLPRMEFWLQAQFRNNTPYDKWVTELVTLPMNRNDQNNVYYYGGGPSAGSPLPFYFAKEGKPEDLAANVSKLFLGVRLECAQCHDHPFGKWTREQFWSQAAFFNEIKRPRMQQEFFFGPLSEVNDRREILIPNTDRVAQAKFLDGNEPKWKFKVGARKTLAEWMTAPENPFFAKAAVNRMWAHLFGIGIVEPIDDFNETNLPSHPELLEVLAKQFVAHQFDLKFLIRAITSSKTYQLQSTSHASAPDARLFARMPVKALSAEQLFDNLCQATGIKDTTPRNQRAFAFQTPRSQFLEMFAAQEKRTETHTSIPQALTLMNNKLITDATHPDRGMVLGAITEAPFMTTAGRIEALFLAALSRKPTSLELEKMTRYVEKGGGTGVNKKGLSDVFWTLLNSTEFVVNH